VCHPQVWAEVQSIAENLRPPAEVTADQVTARGDGLAEIVLAGVQLAMVMHSLRTAYFDDIGDLFGLSRRFTPPHRAVARRVYLAMARTVEQVSSTHTGTVPPIVIDDRVPGSPS
jgi:hypothetical protein